jgi:hypothetical protein
MTLSNTKLWLYTVFLCVVSHFVYCYAVCHYTEDHCAECHYAVCRYTEDHCGECHYAVCHYTEDHCAECHYTECHCAKCCGAYWVLLKVHNQL